MLTLRDYQDGLVADVTDAFNRTRRVCLQLATGGGKCLAPETPVLLFDGRIKPASEVRRGDLLMGPDSLPRKVLATAVGRDRMYRIVPTRGDPFVVNEPHILSLQMTPSNRTHPSGRTRMVEISVHDYLHKSATFKHRAKGWRTGIEWSNAEPLPVDPYYLGLWLGDGDRTQTSITTGDTEIISWLSSYAATLGMITVTEANSANSVNIAIREPGSKRGPNQNRLLQAMRRLHVIRNKHVPRQYLVASRIDRLSLLAGIIDSDGHNAGKGFNLTLKDERLMDDTIFLARSLGFASFKSRVTKTCVNNGKAGTYFSTCINGAVDSVPTKIARKRALPRRQKKDHLRFGFEVKSLGVGDYAGFELDGDGLFLLGDFTVTHNTPIFSYLVQQLAKNMRSSLILAHRRELVRQASAKLTEFEVVHGIVQAGFCESMAMSLVGSVQTVVNRLQRMRAPTVIVIDEAHHSVASTWKRILAHWPEAYVLGVTATPDRPDGRGLREVGYGELVIGPPMRTLINQGHLADYDYYAPPTKADLSGVATRAGDYAKDQLAAAMDKAVIVGDALEHYRRIFKGAPAFVFCVSVEHAHHVADAYRAQGYRAAAVDGDMDMHERDQRIKAFTRGELNAIMSCDLIGEGLDVPGAQGAQFLRPTKSLIIYLQQAGRAMRPKADGSRAIFLDHVGSYLRFGAPCQDREWSLDGAKKAKPTDGASTCKLCYHVFPTKKTPRQTGECPFSQDECPYLQVNGMIGRPAPQQVEGELKRVDIQEKYDVRPPWAGGIDISTARGFDLKLAIERADTREKLEHIRLVRGYQRGWVFHIMEDRKSRGQAA